VWLNKKEMFTIYSTYRCCLKTQPTNGVHDSAPDWRQGQDNVLLASCSIVVPTVDVYCCTCSSNGPGDRG